MKRVNYIFKKSIYFKGLTFACAALAFSAIVFYPVSGQAALTAANLEQAQLHGDTAQVSGQISVGDSLIPLGRTTGIKIFAQGAVIVGFSEIDSIGMSPAKQSGLQLGDVVIELDGKEVASNSDFVEHLSDFEDETAAVIVMRQGEQITLDLIAHLDEQSGSYKVGAWIRDSIAGIGTITFVDPKTGSFGALGHGICDADTGMLVPFDSGSLMYSTVVDVKKGEQQAPGELIGSFDLKNDQGVLFSNTNHGIFGEITDVAIYEDMEPMEVASKEEIELGSAYILSNISGETVERYEIEIERIYENAEGARDMMISISDDKLIGQSGGIVQGMSGSPILQNGKLIGAVTHVLVNDPTRGYGIFIESMLESAENISN